MGLLLCAVSLSFLCERPEGLDDAERRPPPLPVTRQELDRKTDLLVREQARARSLASSAGPQWRNLGPTSGGVTSYYVDAGRLRAIATSPTNAGTIYIGTASGGVFRTTNADSAGDWTWTPLTDDLPAASGSGNITVGDLAISPTDSRTLWLGMGDPIGHYAWPGFFSSHDGGDTWQRGGDLPATAVWKILALDGSTLLVATNVGLWRSTDGGASFKQLPIAGVLSTLQAPGTIQVTTLTRFPNGRLLMGTFADTGIVAIWFSDDNGANWTQAQLTMDAKNPQRFTIATSRASSNVAYAMVNDMAGLLVTSNGGQTWTELPFPELDTGQTWYNQLLIVDDSDPNRFFVGTRQLYRSTDGGKSFSWIFGTHPDHHVAAWWQVGGKTKLLLGTDGGLALLADPLTNYYADSTHNKGVASHEIYQMGCSGDSTAVGTQDNGTRLTRDGSGQFDFIAGGDGYSTILNPVNPDFVLMEANLLKLRSTDAGRTSFVVPSIPDDYWGAEMVLDEGDPSGNTIYRVGVHTVYRSTDFGATFTALGTTGLPTDGLLRFVAAAPSDHSTLAAVIFRGQSETYVSTDAGATWSLQHIDSVSPNLSIAFDSSDAHTLYIGAQSGRVVQRSRDLGRTWQALDGGGYPAGIATYAVRNDPASSSVLYAANDFGLYWSQDAGATWSRYGRGLPWVGVRALCFVPAKGVLRAATYGRGVWEAPLPQSQLTVSLSPPSVTLAPGAQQAVTVTVSGAAALAISGLPAGISGSFDHASLTSPGAARLTLSAASSAAPAAPATYTVTATHAGATTGSAQGQVSIARGSGTAHIASPADGATLFGTITIAASGTLSAGAGALRISLDGVAFASDPSLSVDARWDTTSVADGPHAVVAEVLDASGALLASATAHVTVSNAPPAGPPQVRIAQPIDGAEVSGDVTIQIETRAAKGTTLAHASILVDGAEIAQATNALWKSTPGTHQIDATVTDSNGASTHAAPVHVSVAAAADPVSPPPASVPAAGHGCAQTGADGPLTALALCLLLLRRRHQRRGGPCAAGCSAPPAAFWSLRTG